jgi:hypothetical protein
MTMNQLSRIVLSGSSGTPDEQAATPDERGSYGELMEEIDLLLAPSADEREQRHDPCFRRATGRTVSE